MNKVLKLRIIEKFDSQIEFAGVIGVDESIVSKVVRGHRALSGPERTRWAAALGSTVKTLFSQN